MADILISQLPAASPLLTDLMIIANPTTGIAKKSTVTQLNNVLTLAGLSDVQQGTPPANSILEWDGGFIYNTNILRNDGLNLNYIPLVSATSPYLLANSQLYNGAYGIEISEDTYLNNASVLFGLSSVTKGFLKPRMTTTEKNAISSPIKGLEVFDNVLNLPYFYNGTAWKGVQELLISATNIKTINGNSILGSGNLIINEGITTLNTLTATTQTFATSTTGTDFTISSATSTHTFNLPTASATARGLLSSANWTTFNNKIGGSGTNNYLAKFTASGTIGNSLIYDNGTNVGIGTATPSEKLEVNGNIIGSYIIANNELYSTNLRTNGIYPNSLTYLPFYSSTSPYNELMRLDNSGALLIGTTISSTYKLDVSGTVRFKNGGSEPFFIEGGTNCTLQIYQSGYDCLVQLGVVTTNSPIRGRVGTVNYYDFTITTNNSTVATATKEGNFLIGTTTNVTSSKLTIESTTQGVLIPRMTTTQIKAIESPVKGLMAFSNDDNVLAFYDGTVWRKVSHATL